MGGGVAGGNIKASAFVLQLAADTPLSVVGEPLPSPPEVEHGEIKRPTTGTGLGRHPGCDMSHPSPKALVTTRFASSSDTQDMESYLRGIALFTTQCPISPTIPSPMPSCFPAVG